jgi:hypothetical protein
MRVKIEFNESMSLFRPGWTQKNLRAFEDAQFCGVKQGHFARTRGMPGRLLRRETEKRGVVEVRDLR